MATGPGEERSLAMRWLRSGVAAGAAFALMLGLWSPAGAQVESNARGGPRLGVFPRGAANRRIEAPGRRAAARSSRSTVECVISPGDAENVLLDCPGNLFPTRESDIA